MMGRRCFECGHAADHDHHVVPRSLGGTRTIPLCESCHGKVHGCGFTSHRALTARGMQRKRTRGEYTGGVAPYGWRVGANGVKLEVHPGEQAASQRARELRESGLSLRAVAARLEAEGLLPRSGGRWHPSTVRDLLRAETA